MEVKTDGPAEGSIALCSQRGEGGAPTERRGRTSTERGRKTQPGANIEKPGRHERPGRKQAPAPRPGRRPRSQAIPGPREPAGAPSARPAPCERAHRAPPRRLPRLRSGSLPLAFLGKYFTRKMEATQSRLCCGVRFTGSPSNLKTEGPAHRAWARSWSTAGARTPGAPSSCILCSTHTAPHRGAGGGGREWGAPQSGGSVKPGVVRPERQTHYLSCWF